MTRERDFWSRRREAVRAEAETDEETDLARAEARDRAELEEDTDEAILAKLDLPDPDTMEAGDDFSKFMARAVPERLRRRALRKLWLSNPLLANVDGLVDYGEDFTDSAMVVENMQTTYQVGKGMLKHVMEMERQREVAENEAAEDEAAESEAAENDVAEIADAAAPVIEPGPLTLAAEDEVPVQDRDVVNEQRNSENIELADGPPLSLPPRRMQFTFESDAA